MTSFYLLIDAKFLYSYLANKWVDAFESYPGYQGILVKEDPPSPELVEKRALAHAKYAGVTSLTTAMETELSELYHDFGDESKNSIRLFGVPRHSIAEYSNVTFIGSDLNSQTVQDWLSQNIEDRKLWVFSHQGQILKPFWIDKTNGQLLNLHTAVLPYARGAYAIQQVAALGDEQLLRQAAGATIHYIDPGIDTGQLIRTERLAEPLRFNNLWELVAYLGAMGDDLYIRTAKDIIENPDSMPAGIITDPARKGPVYLRKDFTPECRRQAEQAYLTLRENWLKRQKL